MTVQLKPEAEALIQQELSSGRFHDPADVIATALLALSDSRPADLTDLDEKLQESMDQIDRGEFYTGEEARAIIAAMRSKL